MEASKKSTQEEDWAVSIELPVWQAPNDDITVYFKRDYLKLSFPTWTPNGNYSKFFGFFELHDVWAMRFERHLQFSYYPHIKDDKFKSCYWKVPNSSWKKIYSHKERRTSLIGRVLILMIISIIFFKVIRFI